VVAVLASCRRGGPCLPCHVCSMLNTLTPWPLLCHQDAKWLVDRKQAFHLESLQFPRSGDGGKLRMKACLDEMVEHWLQQGL
jgi:hypothetical protein